MTLSYFTWLDYVEVRMSNNNDIYICLKNEGDIWVGKSNSEGGGGFWWVYRQNHGHPMATQPKLIYFNTVHGFIL